jgi:uncharacterized protein (DUF1800 family)
MAIVLSPQAALALHRFGFGPRGDATSALAGDPRGALIAELDRADAGRLYGADLLASDEAARAVFDFRLERKAARLAALATAAAPPVAAPNAAAAVSNIPAPTASPPATPSPAVAPPSAATPKPDIAQQIFLDEAKARLDAALSAETGFVERLVWFWSNHFCVSADKVRPLAGAFEREAIRPHVLGRFADMVAAVESHPAMLAYLDNAASIGPNSVAGRRRGKGLNENLAREILELHTLGVDGGYTQGDVTSFARIITGWTVIPAKQERGGAFEFNDKMHEPGEQALLGRRYADSGVTQGREAVADLVRHPATARHVARKLARHFVADMPSDALVAALADTFSRTDGDLKAVTQRLIGHDDAWSEQRSRLKRPSEWLVGAYRGVGDAALDVRQFINATNILGEPLWRPPSPKGFDDASAAWTDGLSQRLDLANQISRRAGGRDPGETVDRLLGPLASAETRRAVGRAESRPQAIALLLMSPEFLRR